MPRVEREAKVKDEGNSVPSGNWSTDSQQIPGTTSEISVQKSAVLGTARILRRTLKLLGFW